MLKKLELDSVDENFIFLKRKNFLKEKKFSLLENHTGAASDIYISKNKNFIFKVKRCKYEVTENCFRWFFRDFLKKLLLFRLDSRREYKGFSIAYFAGLKTPSVYGWGISTHPFSRNLSFICTEYMHKTIPGITYFKSANAEEKRGFIRDITNDLIKLAKFGYYYRDLNLDNILVDERNKLIWIDTHFNRVSIIRSVKLKQVYKSIVNRNSGLDDFSKTIKATIKKELG